MNKTLTGIICAAFAAGALTSCGSVKVIPYVESQEISKQNNPFIYNVNYDIDPFTFLGEPVDNLKGTVVDSSLGELAAYSDFYDMSLTRYFSWVALRDQSNLETYYLVYPGERLIPPGTRVEISRYWPVESTKALSNNQLVYLLTPEFDRMKEPNLDYTVRTFDGPVESGAPDGLIDGIIEPFGISYIEPEAGQ